MNTHGITDTYGRAMWALAQRHVTDQDRTRDVAPDDPAVVALRDLLVHAFECGAERTLGQGKALDDALACAAGMAPPTVLHVHPCPRCSYPATQWRKGEPPAGVDRVLAVRDTYV